MIFTSATVPHPFPLRWLRKARDIQGRKNRIVAVIGDGSMTSGLAFEALNHGGQLQTDLVVVPRQ